MTLLKVHKSSNGQFFVRLVSSNGNILGHSETYVAKADAVHCAALIKAQAGSAVIQDLT